VSNPYDILEPTVISFSGGRTSAFMLHKVLLNGGGATAKPSNSLFCEYR
jgi:predicted phosphoadenosine phosphosulfate sulfurtransferase